ncbi:MAG: DUF4157 domain-containing protein [Acidobacteria bacterium]|nr:DUF4157 domain-containing protein [Acidobacteriota bacterium]
MKLSPAAHDEVESFLKGHLGDSGLRLPRFSVHVGWPARLLMKVVRMGAITFGRHVFISPRLVERDESGRARLPGWLLVHEAAHVLQYRERGFAGFLYFYLRGYWRALRAGHGWGAEARMLAYLSIPHEREARRAEHAYVEEKLRRAV